MTKPRFWCVVPAAGVGKRFNSLTPKQYLSLGDRTVAEHTLLRLKSIEMLSGIAVVISAEDRYWPTLPDALREGIRTTEGGTERSDSVAAGLQFLYDEFEAHDNDWVLVHDIARPCVRMADVERLIERLQSDPVGGLLGVPAVDTMKSVFPDRSDCIKKTVDRQTLWHAYTPQMFRLGLLKHSLQQCFTEGFIVTDEASAIERCGHQVKLVEGSRDNLKVTHPRDLALAAFFLQQQALESGLP